MNQSAAYVLQNLLNIVQLACFYMPLAAAFALIQAITRRVFLSFGDFAMFGSFAAVYICFGRLLQGDSDLTAALLSLAAAMICAGALGQVSARLIFAPLIKGSSLSFMIAALGFSIAIEEVMRLTTDARDVWVPPLFTRQAITLVSQPYPVKVTLSTLLAMSLSAVSLIALALLLKRTQFGRKWQACAQNEVLARLCGVNTPRVIELTFVVGGSPSRRLRLDISYFLRWHQFLCGGYAWL